MRGLYIATGQYSSLCVGAVVFTLGGEYIEDGVPDREQVDCEREEVNDGEKQERENEDQQRLWERWEMIQTQQGRNTFNGIRRTITSRM